MQVIQLSCPACKKKIKLMAELAGKKVKCTCGQKLLVPSVTESASDDDNFGLVPEPVNWRTTNLSQEPSTPIATTSTPDIEPVKSPSPTSLQPPKRSSSRILLVLLGIVVIGAGSYGTYYYIKDRNEKQAEAAKVQEANDVKEAYQKAIKFYGSGAYKNAIEILDRLVAKKPDSMEYRKLRRDLYMSDGNPVAAKEEASFILTNGASDMRNDLILCKTCMVSNDPIIYRHFSRLIGKYKIDEIGMLEIQNIISHIIGRKETPGLTHYFELYMGALYSDLLKGDMIDPSGLLKIDEAVQHMMSDEIKITAFTKEIEFMELSKQPFEFKVKFGSFVEQESAKSELKFIDKSIAAKKETIELLRNNVKKYQELKRAAAEAIKKRNQS